MVHQDSVVGDDGSHRLLVVPCALVVLVLVLMVTACSAVRDEAGAGGSAGKEWPAETAATQTADGRVAEPVVTEDGRMIQPAGHTGIWFETEPDDPLEKLVYESQRFVGQPVALEPIGERALLPQWEDMPDPCHPEVIRRMEELGFEVAVKTDLGAGIALCGLISDGSVENYSFGFEIGFAELIYPYEEFHIVFSDRFPVFEHAIPPGYNSFIGCVGLIRSESSDYAAIATSSIISGNKDCNSSVSALQLGLNVMGVNNEF